MTKSFKEKVQAMSGKEIVMTMVNGLLHGHYNIDMASFGKTKDGICYGCAATNCIAEISGIRFKPDQIYFRNDRCNALDVDYEFLDTFVNADCFDVFPFIEDKSIDAIICDLPYGTTQNKWDSVLPLNLIWEQYKRIIKDNGAIILFAQTPFDKVLGASNLPMLKYEWIWRKSRPTGHLNANKMPMKAHENILVFYKKPPTFNKQMTIGKPNHVKDGSIRKSKATNNNYGHFENVVQKATELKNPVTVIEFSQQDPNKIEHPTQKPIELMEYLVKTYTNEGDMVLDNTMGSGTTILAAIKNNRIGIGIEKEKQYYDVAVRRASEYCH